MSVLERRFDEAGSAAAVAGRTSENVASAGEASTARRIRLGLTGLAAIFLFVMIAAVGLRPTASQATPEPQAEPLAVLGVAPGAGPVVNEVKLPPPPAHRPSQT